MPTYTFVKKSTGETREEFMSISEMEDLLKADSDLDVMCGTPAFGDPFRLGITKPREAFRDQMKEIKRKHYKSTIDI